MQILYQVRVKIAVIGQLCVFRNYSATKYGIFATDCTNLRRFKTTKGGLLAKID